MSDREVNEAAFQAALVEWKESCPLSWVDLNEDSARFFFFAGAAHGVGALRHEVEHETAPN